MARSRSDSSAPLLWRMRHQMGRVWFTIALGISALGAFAVVYALVVGPIDGAAIGLPLLVGGALLAVGFRRKTGRR